MKRNIHTSKKTIAIIVLMLMLIHTIGFGCIANAAEAKTFPKGIYSLFRGDRTDAPFQNLESHKSWQNENITGICLRSFWDKVEPTEGKYDFSHFEAGLALGQKHGKKVAVSVAAGDATPNWVYEKGTKYYEQDWNRNGDMAKFPLVWDEVFLEEWSQMIAALGNKFDPNPTLSYVTVGGLGRYVETFYSNNPNDYERFESIGGTKNYLSGAKRVIDAYAKAFPNTPIYLAIGSPWRGAGSSEALDQLISYTLTTYPGRFGLMSHALNAQSDANYNINKILVDNSQKAPVGFQMLWSTNSAGATGKTIKGTLAEALQKGVELKTNFIEVYEIDVDNAQYGEDIKRYNDLLIESSVTTVDQAKQIKLTWRYITWQIEQFYRRP